MRAWDWLWEDWFWVNVGWIVPAIACGILFGTYFAERRFERKRRIARSID